MGAPSVLNKFRRPIQAAGTFERANAAACRKASEVARAEGDEAHAIKMECEAQAWESKAIDAVRKDREQRCGVYDNSF